MDNAGKKSKELSPEVQSAGAAMKWEYWIVASLDARVPADYRAELERRLNEMGQDEWEVCGTLNIPQDIGHGTLVSVGHVILKREWLPPKAKK